MYPIFFLCDNNCADSCKIRWYKYENNIKIQILFTKIIKKVIYTTYKLKYCREKSVYRVIFVGSIHSYNDDTDHKLILDIFKHFKYLYTNL